jgi:ABC-type nickel/cobalt efflux system permease component RcnA
VPCWDAIGLVVLAEAIGRLALGVALLVAFGLGMAAVLVAVGWLAASLRRNFVRMAGRVDWEYRLGIASGLVLTVIGVYLMG